MWTTKLLSPPTFLALIFLAALLLRIALVFFASTYRIDPSDNHWNFGYEMGRIAKSIATGRGFAGPMKVGSEPTAWCAPVFPLVLAAIFKALRIYSTGSAIVIYIVDSIGGYMLAPVLG